MALDIKAVRATVTTTSSTTDWTSTGFGTPKAALWIFGSASSDGTAAAMNQIGMGVTDGTNQWESCLFDDDGDATTDCYRASESDEVLQWIRNNGNYDGESNFNQWITDGVQTTDANNPGSNKFVHAILFGGSDITNVKVGNFNTSASLNGTVDVDVGFEPDLVIFFRCGTVAGTKTTHAQFSVGAAHNDTGNPQVCHGFHSVDNVGTTDVDQYFRTNRIGSVPQPGNVRTYEVTDWYPGPTPAAGFEVTTRDLATDTTFGYLALKFSGDVNVKIGNFTTPTSTGTDAVTGVGFQPDTVFLFGSTAATADSVVAGGTIGMSIFDGTDDYSYYGSSEDAVGTSNTQTLSDDQALHIPDNDGADEIKATYSSMDSGGFTLNYSDVLGTGRYVGYCALELSGVAPPAGMPGQCTLVGVGQ
jgi:hypothetical protein